MTQLRRGFGSTKVSLAACNHAFGGALLFLGLCMHVGCACTILRCLGVVTVLTVVVWVAHEFFVVYLWVCMSLVSMQCRLQLHVRLCVAAATGFQGIWTPWHGMHTPL